MLPSLNKVFCYYLLLLLSQRKGECVVLENIHTMADVN